MTKHDDTAGLILAGGKARRMGGNDKGLVRLNGRTMIEYVIDSLSPQVGSIYINANRNLETYQTFGHDVLEDRLNDFQGPLAGFASGLQSCSSDYLVTAPCDGPFICDDYVDRLHMALKNDQASISVAFDGQRLQPVYALLHTELLDSLLSFLHTGNRKIDLWYEQVGYTKADFSDVTSMFININTPEELARIEQEISNETR